MTPAPRSGMAARLRLGVALASMWAVIACTAPGCYSNRELGGGPGASDAGLGQAREEPFVTRPLTLSIGDRWIGDAIAYGPHRNGQRPGGSSPTRDEIREDLRIMSRHWSLLRTYGSVGPSGTLLEIIRDDSLEMKVMLGAWIDVEERRDSTGAVVEAFPEARAANRREIEAAIRLANAHPRSVIAVCVGNETQVFWSAHRSPADLLIAYIREARARTGVPVTTADDFNFWNKPESRDVAEELDFIVTHAHPLWNGRSLDEALDWTRRTYAEVQAAHPGRMVVLGETGWATSVHTEGEQARLIRGRVGEEEQRTFHRALTAWIREARIPTFFFEAFDENWKGGAHPNEVEKHWGLYRADRSPKRAMAGDD